jgi:hypothetical protein
MLGRGAENVPFEKDALVMVTDFEPVTVIVMG